MSTSSWAGDDSGSHQRPLGRPRAGDRRGPLDDPANSMTREPPRLNCLPAPGPCLSPSPSSPTGAATTPPAHNKLADLRRRQAGPTARRRYRSSPSVPRTWTGRGTLAWLNEEAVKGLMSGVLGTARGSGVDRPSPPGAADQWRYSRQCCATTSTAPTPARPPLPSAPGRLRVGTAHPRRLPPPALNEAASLQYSPPPKDDPHEEGAGRDRGRSVVGGAARAVARGRPSRTLRFRHGDLELGVAIPHLALAVQLTGTSTTGWPSCSTTPREALASPTTPRPGSPGCGLSNVLALAQATVDITTTSRALPSCAPGLMPRRPSRAPRAVPDALGTLGWDQLDQGFAPEAVSCSCPTWPPPVSPTRRRRRGRRRCYDGPVLAPGRGGFPR